MVTGAVSNMDRDKIKVVIDARPVNIAGQDSIGGIGSTLLETVQAWETKYCRQIEEQLFYFGNVRVSVTGSVNVENTKMRSRDVDAKKTSVQPKSVQTTNTETNSTAPGSGDVSTGANIGVSVTAGGGAQSNTSVTTTEKTENQIDPSWVEKDTSRPPGEFTALQASVRLPRTYFEAVAKRQSGGKEPSESEVDAAIQSLLPGIRGAIAKCTNIKKEDDISVDTYYDFAPLGGNVATAGVASAGGGLSAMIGGWGKEVAVGVLAVISLFMVSTMVKKSTPAPLIVATTEAKGPSELMGGEDVAGLATEGGPQLAGMELDDDTIQTQQILDQVQNMVGENPDAAANLVKRWLNRT
jgi:flagellar biosynthesis/type III secretory pathway M-ring protein FliF/YscJ